MENIKIINYAGGCHGEFLAHLVHTNHKHCWTNNPTGDAHGIQDKYRTHNRFAMYDFREEKRKLALGPFWTGDKDLISFYQEHCGDKLLVVRTHGGHAIKSQFPMINVHAEDLYWHHRAELCKIYKQWFSDSLAKALKPWRPRNNKFKYNLQIGKFFNGDPQIFESFFGVTYNKDQVQEYYEADENNLYKYFGNWRKKDLTETIDRFYRTWKPNGPRNE